MLLFIKAYCDNVIIKTKPIYLEKHVFALDKRI